RLAPWFAEHVYLLRRLVVFRMNYVKSGERVQMIWRVVEYPDAVLCRPRLRSAVPLNIQTAGEQYVEITWLDISAFDMINVDCRTPPIWIVFGGSARTSFLDFYDASYYHGVGLLHVLADFFLL